MTVAISIVFVLSLLVVGALVLSAALLSRSQSAGRASQGSSPKWAAGAWLMTIVLLGAAGLLTVRGMLSRLPANSGFRDTQEVPSSFTEGIQLEKSAGTDAVASAPRTAPALTEPATPEDDQPTQPSAESHGAEVSERLQEGPDETESEISDDETAVAGDTKAAGESLPPEQLPGWIRAGRQQSGEDLLLAVASRPRMTLEEAESDVQTQARQLLIAEWHERHETAANWMPPREVLDWSELVIDRHDQIKLIDLGQGRTTPMHILHWRVALTPQVDDSLATVWKDDLRESRLTWLAGAALLLTLCSAIACASLKVFKTAISPIAGWVAACLAVAIVVVMTLAALRYVL